MSEIPQGRKGTAGRAKSQLSYSEVSKQRSRNERRKKAAKKANVTSDGDATPMDTVGATQTGQTSSQPCSSSTARRVDKGVKKADEAETRKCDSGSQTDAPASAPTVLQTVMEMFQPLLTQIIKLFQNPIAVPAEERLSIAMECNRLV